MATKPNNTNVGGYYQGGAYFSPVNETPTTTTSTNTVTSLFGIIKKPITRATDFVKEKVFQMNPPSKPALSSASMQQSNLGPLPEPVTNKPQQLNPGLGDQISENPPSQYTDLKNVRLSINLPFAPPISQPTKSSNENTSLYANLVPPTENTESIYNFSDLPAPQAQPVVQQPKNPHLNAKLNAWLNNFNPEIQVLECSLNGIEKVIAEQITAAEDKNCEAPLRDALTRKFIAGLATLYRSIFQDTGIINENSLQKTGDQLRALLNGNGNGYYYYDPKIGLLYEAFGMQNTIQAKAQVLQSHKQRQPGQEGYDELAKKQLETLDRAEEQYQILTKQWNEAITVPAPIPSAPPMNEELKVAPVETTTINPPANPTPLIVASSTPIVKPTPVVANPVTTVLEVSKEAPVKLVSYIDIAYREALKKTDKEAWDSLPAEIQRDALLHTIRICTVSGKAEEIANRIFSRSQLLNMLTASKAPERKKYQEILDLFYSYNSDYYTFSKAFKATPFENEPLFLHYVYENAIEAGVKIEEWDQDWARNHWHEDKYLRLSLIALERFVHTTS